MANHTHGPSNGHPQPPRGMGPDDIAHLLAGRIGTGRPPAPRAPQPTAQPPTPPAPPPPGPGPGALPALERLPGQLPVGWDVIEALQGAVSAQLTKQDPERLLGEDDRRALARSLAATAVADWAAKYAQGNAALSSAEDGLIVAAVYDAMYRGGRLQALLDEDGVEDVMVDGLRATVRYYDRPARTVEKVADSHEELIALINRMAQISGHGERALSQASPSVGFRLPDGSRVTASLLTGRPSVVIRRHRIRQHGIDELVRWGSLNPHIAQFLTACVVARQNLLIVGDMGSGKTSLLRALGREIPDDEVLVTLESDRELYLDEPGPKPGPLTFAFEARQSNGERIGDNRLAGEITISDMFPVALRYNASRVIVGEVRSSEIVPMLQAMSAGGSGSMCTIHVRRPHGIISRLVQLATEAGMDVDAAHHLIAGAIDVVVYLAYDFSDVRHGGRRHRYISHIYEVDDVVGEAGRPVLTELFAPHGYEPRAVFRTMPSFVAELEHKAGFDRRQLTDNPLAAWGAPLQKVGPR
ncbi:CpaF family protein [Streptomyces sp. NPDC093097]|uniref:CpaF family protein n=1 Tax=Streptomyces sp. NPDC093097 TaxID=3366027 RepID=UPI00381C9DAF